MLSFSRKTNTSVKTMELLKIKHEDFTLTVESTRFQSMWDRGVANLGEGKMASTYRWSEGVESVMFDEKPIVPEDKEQPAIFFEQTDYCVWVDFKKRVSKAWFDSPRKDVNDRFSWKRDKQLLAGFLNYGNEIGRAESAACECV